MAGQGPPQVNRALQHFIQDIWAQLDGFSCTQILHSPPGKKPVIAAGMPWYMALFGVIV